MIGSNTYTTFVFKNLVKEQRKDLIYHENFSAASDSHAIDERDALLSCLAYAEAALSDIGDAEREPGDDLEWCEYRAAQTLPRVRALLKAHGYTIWGGLQ